MVVFCGGAFGYRMLPKDVHHGRYDVLITVAFDHIQPRSAGYLPV